MSKKSIFNASAVILFDTDTSCFSASFNAPHFDTASFDAFFDNSKSLSSAEGNAENKIQKSVKSKLEKNQKMIVEKLKDLETLQK